MDVRIGIAETQQIVEVEMEDDIDRDALKSQVESAISGDSKVLWLEDRKGREIAVPVGQIAFVDIGSADAERRIGFGA